MGDNSYMELHVYVVHVACIVGGQWLYYALYIELGSVAWDAAGGCW